MGLKDNMAKVVLAAAAVVMEDNTDNQAVEIIGKALVDNSDKEVVVEVMVKV